MTELLKFKDFQSLLNQKFQIEQAPEKWIDAELIDAKESKFIYPEFDREGRTSFSIVFRAGQDVHLPQKMYLIKHDQIGEHQIFIVPLQPDEKGTYYEAVFT